jgi:hypothetical protein
MIALSLEEKKDKLLCFYKMVLNSNYLLPQTYNGNFLFQSKSEFAKFTLNKAIYSHAHQCQLKDKQGAKVGKQYCSESVNRIQV